MIVNTIKDLLFLIIKRWIKGNNEGDRRVLSIMRLKGQLKALFNENESFKANREVIKILNLKASE